MTFMCTTSTESAVESERGSSDAGEAEGTPPTPLIDVGVAATSMDRVPVIEQMPTNEEVFLMRKRPFSFSHLNEFL